MPRAEIYPRCCLVGGKCRGVLDNSAISCGRNIVLVSTLGLHFHMDWPVSVYDR
jgi:hypothetical protein